jgi:hypothetical protein
MDLKSRLKYSRVFIFIRYSDCHYFYFGGLGQNIDGNALMRLTDNDISQLFLEMNEDGTIQEPTIGLKSRFRTKLIEWKMNHSNE